MVIVVECFFSGSFRDWRGILRILSNISKRVYQVGALSWDHPGNGEVSLDDYRHLTALPDNTQTLGAKSNFAECNKKKKKNVYCISAPLLNYTGICSL